MDKPAPLLRPITMGAFELRNRCIMAALTRKRADPKDGVPTDMHVKYYAERGSNAGFILTECSAVHPRGKCFPGSCGIWSDEQAEGWKKVTDAVHAVGGRIYLQIWHCGRSVLKEDIGGEKPLAPSAIKNRHKGDEPEALTVEEIKELVGYFKKGAERALKAGFDGLQLHGANGYLIDQFIRDATNKREDSYGSSVENRCRFPLEVIDALISVFGADRVGIKISPCGRFNDMFDSNPLEHYKYFLQELDNRKLAFIEIRRQEVFKSENHYGVDGYDQIPDIFRALRPFYKGTFIGNESVMFEEANKLIEEGILDAVSYGKYYISNPDLAIRFQKGYGLAPYDFSTFYTPGEKGYLDYPAYDEQIKAQSQDNKK